MKVSSWIGAVLVTVAALAAATATTEPTSIRYEVTALKGKLEQELATGRQRLSSGAVLASGDVVRTGWFSGATIAAPQRAADFALGARTRIRLAHEVPGALLEIERGRLHAIFHPWPGAEEGAERIVTTPSLILAVRGTDYGVEVVRGGVTTVAVFSGAVAALNRVREDEGLLLEAGQACTFRHGRPSGEPWRHGSGQSDWERGRGFRRTPPTEPGSAMDGPMSGRPPTGNGGSRRSGSSRHGG